MTVPLRVPSSDTSPMAQIPCQGGTPTLLRFTPQSFLRSLYLPKTAILVMMAGSTVAKTPTRTTPCSRVCSMLAIPLGRHLDCTSATLVHFY